MAQRLKFRDRFYTPRVAQAVTSPSAILATGVVGALGVLAFGPFGLLAGALGYAARVAFAIPRNEKTARIDPFGVGEPWRKFVSEALQSQRRFAEAIRGMAGGPLQERLVEIGGRLDTGVEEVWEIARRGHLLAQARKRLDPAAAQYELGQVVEENREHAWVEDSPVAQTARALQAQIDTAARMDGVIRDTVNRLRLMDARMDEMVTRAVELSVQAQSSDDLGGLGADVDGLVTEMEALRQALDETSGRPVEMPDPPSAATGPG